MASHVSRQDNSNKALSESLKIISCQFFEEIVLLLIQNSKRLGRMKVFLDGLVAVTDGALRDLIYVVGVRKTVMPKVVTNRAHTK